MMAVPDDDMCGVTVNQVFPASRQWHPLLLEALSGIPDVRAGDSVRWHCDMIHSVAPVRDAFRTGSSPADFPAEHYERGWAGRFQPGDLNDTGLRGLGLASAAPRHAQRASRNGGYRSVTRMSA